MADVHIYIPNPNPTVGERKILIFTEDGKRGIHTDDVISPFPVR